MKPGRVSLVGAGPGDPGLITLKGMQCIESADVVVYDRLINMRLLGHANPNAELIDVGKIPGERGMAQTDINTLLATKAKEGKTVVRLKGGDPFVFGRGGEEAETLSTEDIPFEVVPGVTSATAVPAYAGIPLTHRGVASSFTVFTGTQVPFKDNSPVPWHTLVQDNGTLVILMGWESLSNTIEALIRHGACAKTPVAIVRWGTNPYQQTVVGTLSDIVDKAIDAKFTAPVVTIIGNVVKLRGRLRWFDIHPLFGKKVLVTRTSAQAGTLSALLVQRGALAIEVPTIQIEPLADYGPLDKALRHLDTSDWVVFSSSNAVNAVFNRLRVLGLDTRAFGGQKVAAIGPTTAMSLSERGIAADCVPKEYLSEGLLTSLNHQELRGRRVLLPQADIASDTLRHGIAALGASVQEVTAYRTVLPKTSASCTKSILSQGIDIATFTSSSTVKNLARLLNGDLDTLSQTTIACIGPITADTASKLGFEVDIVAKEHTIVGLVEALETHYRKENDRQL